MSPIRRVGAGHSGWPVGFTVGLVIVGIAVAGTTSVGKQPTYKEGNQFLFPGLLLLSDGTSLGSEIRPKKQGIFSDFPPPLVGQVQSRHNPYEEYYDPQFVRESSSQGIFQAGNPTGWGVPALVSAPTETAPARVSAVKLLPPNTVLLLWVPNAPELAKRFMNTAMGRMSQDPQMKPLVQDVYGSVVDAVANLKDQIGLTLPELLEIPQGEILLAVVAPEQGPLGAVLLLQAGQQMDRLRQLLAKGTEAVEKQPNVQKSEQTIEDTKVVIYNGLGPERRQAMYCEKDGCLVLSTDLDILKGILSAWHGGAEKTLADNEHFGAVWKHCRGSKDQPAQLFWFFDPIGLLRKLGQENIQVRLFVASLPALGLDGVLGMGGSLTYDVGQFDEVVHFHLLLDNPRSGIVEMIALEPGDVRPENWVPPDAATYATFHWRFQTTMATLAKLYDSFRGEGAFSAELRRRVLDQTGIDLEKEILPALDGRVTYVTRINREEPLSLQSSSWCWALRLKETKPIEEALEKLAKRYEKNIRKETYGLSKYYHVIPPEPPRPEAKPPAEKPDSETPGAKEPPGARRPRRPRLAFQIGLGPQEPPRPPEPCLGIVQNYLIITDRPSMYEKILAQADKPRDTLADALDFKLIAAKIARTAAGNQPVLISFNRPEEGMRWLYDLVQSEGTKERLRQAAQENPFWKRIQEALEKNPLPPFEVLQQYLAPGGAMILDDQTGLHYTSFTLRRGQPKE